MRAAHETILFGKLPTTNQTNGKRHNEIQGMFFRKKKIKNTFAAKQLFNRYIKHHSWWRLKRYLNFVIFKYRLDQLFLDGNY